MTRPVSFFRRVTILLELYRENWQGGNIYRGIGSLKVLIYHFLDELVRDRCLCALGTVLLKYVLHGYDPMFPTELILY